MKVSPLAPKNPPELQPLNGVRMATAEAGIKYAGRKDLLLMVFDEPAAVAGVFTTSKCSSAPVDWCRSALSADVPVARAVVINAGNANAFTGKKGSDATRMTAQAASEAVGCPITEIYLASTGVIGEPLEAEAFAPLLADMSQSTTDDAWREAAEAIMTTDTYPKVANATFESAGKTYRINGIAKGSGMIAPDMATMLSFVVTDAAVRGSDLQSLLDELVGDTFNAVTVDSDTSTSDTLMVFATGQEKPLEDIDGLRKALQAVFHDLAMQIVRDGEGATKHVEINVRGAENDHAAKRIAFSVANSPLVKTAIAGEDANWGRIVAAVGKAGEAANRDKLQISFGDILVAVDGERNARYSEEAASAVMQKEEIAITIDVGTGGKGTARVWTCDLTKEYVAINGDYRS